MGSPWKALSDDNRRRIISLLKRMKDTSENKCIKCGKMYSDHPSTGRFNTVILFGNECAWNPDNEFKGFVKSTLKTSGYDLLDYGYE